MARRRKSGIGRPKRIEKETPADRKRRALMSRGFMGNTGDKRWGFSSRHLGKVDACVFFHPFAAKRYLDMMLAGITPRWADEQTIETGHGVVIVGDKLRKIYDYELKKGEAEYVMPESYSVRVASLRNYTPAPDYLAIGPERRKRKRSRKGMFKIDAIADELGLTPRLCRAALRKNNVEKPEHGWAWETRAEVDEIKRIITGKNIVTVNFKGIPDGET